MRNLFFQEEEYDECKNYTLCEDCEFATHLDLGNVKCPNHVQSDVVWRKE